MDIKSLAKKLDGYQTILTIQKTLKVKKRTAINYISLLRKQGYIEKTIYQPLKIRMYKISTLKKPKSGISLYEYINKNSKVGIVVKQDYIIHKKLTPEEALIKAILTKRFRIILASLGLFKKIKNWSLLYKLAKKENLERKIGALYDTAKTIMKVKKIDKRTKNALLKSKTKDKYILKNFKTKDLKEIEKKWKIYIPFNKADLLIYKEW